MSNATIQNESLLMQRIKAKEQAAFVELYDAFASIIYGMSMRVLRNPTLAEEATQDTFMKVWRQAGQWNPQQGQLLSWILTIARYTAIDRLRQEQRQSPWTAVGLDEILEIASKSADIMSWSDIEVLRELIAQLPAEQIEAIELAFFFGMSHTEIAEYLNQPLGTIKSRIRDGLGKLRRWWLRIET